MIGEQGHRPGLLAVRGGGTASLFCGRNGTLPTGAKWGALLKAGGVLGSLQTLGGKTLASVYIDYALYYSWALGHTPRDAGAGTGGPDLLGALTVRIITTGTQTLTITGQVQGLEPCFSA